MFSSLQYCPDRTSHRYCPSSTNRTSRSCSLTLSHARISLILSKTNKARRRSSFGAAIGNPLIHKLVKPIKVARSRTTDEVRVDQLLVIEAETQVRAADAAVLRETNTAVTSKLACFDLTGG